MIIRHATLKNVEKLAKIEEQSYPKEEKASRKSIEQRVENFGDYFWILEENNNILAFINGMLTNKKNLEDEMYEDATKHNKNGKNYMIFSVVTNPDFREKGYATVVMKKLIEDLEKENRKEIVLTCKENLLEFYKKFGFEDEGISTSEHGGAKWYQMRKKL